MALSPMQRAHRWFWGLVLAAVLLSGALSTEILAEPSPVVGVSVLVTGVALVLVVTQATRLMIAINRAARNPSRGRPSAAE